MLLGCSRDERLAFYNEKRICDLKIWIWPKLDAEFLPRTSFKMSADNAESRPCELELCLSTKATLMKMTFLKFDFII